MFKIQKLADAPRTDMENGRGTVIRMVGESIGAKLVDVHMNVLRPGEPGGHYHYHASSENVYWVLSGRGRLVVDGQEHEIVADDVVFLPPGVRHSLTNASPNEELRLLEIYAPAARDFVVADDELRAQR